MNERSLKVLEFNKVKELIKKYARTSGGKEKVDDLAPYETLYEVNNKLEETNHIKLVYEDIEQYRVLKPNVKYIVNIDKDIKMKIDSNDFK